MDTRGCSCTHSLVLQRTVIGLYSRTPPGELGWACSRKDVAVQPVQLSDGAKTAVLTS